jgi:RNA polymerase sigma-70 factor (ECF subfamily)
MEPADERRIAAGLRTGAADAWAALYDAFAEPVWRSVARLMGANSADVADVVQETFLAAARSARGYDPERGSLAVWLGGIARRQVALWYRKQAKQERLKVAAWPALAVGDVTRFLGSLASAPQAVAERMELAQLVRATLLELPDDYEHLLTAKYLDELSVEQLAGEMRCSEVAVRSKLARARAAFRQMFEKYVQPEKASGGR